MRERRGQMRCWHSLARSSRDAPDVGDFLAPATQLVMVDLPMVRPIVWYSVLCVAPVTGTAALVFESSTTASYGSLGAGYWPIENDQLLGARFHLAEPVLVEHIGGDLIQDPNSTATIFGAIAALGAGGFPTGKPLALQPLAVTVFSPPRTGEDMSTPLSVLLQPRDYALIFGGGLFGSTVDHIIPDPAADMPQDNNNTCRPDYPLSRRPPLFCALLLFVADFIMQLLLGASVFWRIRPASRGLFSSLIFSASVSTDVATPAMVALACCCILENSSAIFLRLAASASSISSFLASAVACAISPATRPLVLLGRQRLHRRHYAAVHGQGTIRRAPLSIRTHDGPTHKHYSAVESNK